MFCKIGKSKILPIFSSNHLPATLRLGSGGSRYPKPKQN